MYTPVMTHLPDPDRQSEFYTGVPLKRGLAWIVDTLIITAITLPIAVVTIVGLFAFPLYFLVIGFLYRWLTIAGGSATWGMRLMAIEFRDSQAQHLSTEQALVHTASYTFLLAIAPLQVISIVMMLVTERGQGLTDMLMGTTALNLRA